VRVGARLGVSWFARKGDWDTSMMPEGSGKETEKPKFVRNSPLHGQICH